MQKNLKAALCLVLIIVTGLGKFTFLSPYTPSDHQISFLGLSLFLLLLFPKDDNVEDGKVVIKVDRKKYHIAYFALYIQVIFLISNYGIPQNIVEGIILVTLLVAGLYAYIK